MTRRIGQNRLNRVAQYRNKYAPGRPFRSQRARPHRAGLFFRRLVGRETSRNSTINCPDPRRVSRTRNTRVRDRDHRTSRKQIGTSVQDWQITLIIRVRGGGRRSSGTIRRPTQAVTSLRSVTRSFRSFHTIRATPAARRAVAIPLCCASVSPVRFVCLPRANDLFVAVRRYLENCVCNRCLDQKRIA